MAYLGSLPPEIFELDITELVLSNNPLKSPTIEVANKGITAMKKYFKMKIKKKSSIAFLYPLERYRLRK